MIQGFLKKIFKSREKFAADRLDNPEQEKPFLEHLEDLRTMIFRIVITLFVSLLICFIFHSKLLDVIQYPLTLIEVPDPAPNAAEDAMVTLDEANPRISIDPVGVFMMAIKVSLLAALTVAFPFIIYFILQFVLPGLRENERKILWPAMGVGFGLFLMGVLFAYFVVVPRAMQFFYMFGVEKGINVQWTIELYTKFAVRFILIFGICFELPVLVMSLVKLDILNYKFMSQRRGIALIIIFFVAALITPTHDALTLALLGAPMYILYEICIWMSFFMERKDRKLNPELYEARDRIEAELEAETDSAEPVQWGGLKEGLFGGDDDDDDDDDDDRRRRDSRRSSGSDYDPDHDESWEQPQDPYHQDDPHAQDPYHQEEPHAEDPYDYDHDDYKDTLHDPDKDVVEDDFDTGGGTRLEASSEENQDSSDPYHHQDPYHHDDPHHDPHHYDPYHYGYHHEDEDYRRQISELESEKYAREHQETTLEEFSARDESGDSVSDSPADVPVGAAPGDTTGIGNLGQEQNRDEVVERIKRLESLVLRMTEKIQFLEDHQDL